MSLMATLPHGRPLTRADLELMPDDGHRYELIDGVLIVSPSPRKLHQRAIGRLFRLLEDACPDDMEVFFAPFDVVLAEDTVLIPDLIVARRVDFDEKCLPAAPLLAVEVLSPSTRRIDLMLKRSRLESAGAASYWVVDPDEPRIIGWQLVDGAYEQVADVRGDDPFHAMAPYPVKIVPARLVADRI